MKDINLAITYNQLTTLLNCMEYALIRGRKKVSDEEVRPLYYSLINTWGENAKKEEQ